MHNQTDRANLPETDGSAGIEQPALRVGSGSSACAGESPAASTLRGFGFTVAAGTMRHWYVGKDGVKRWVHNDMPTNVV